MSVSFINAAGAAEETKTTRTAANVHGAELVKIAPPGTNSKNSVTSDDKSRFPLRSADLRLEMQSTHSAVKPILIDVRPQNEFAAGRVEGAFNLPLPLVKAKTFYKQRRVVLMDGGHDDDLLIEGAMSLAKAGFGSVLVLKGGMAGWRMSGGQVIGENPADIEWAVMTAEEAHGVAHEPNWLVVDAGGTASTLVSSHFPNVLHLAFGDGGDSILEAVAQASTGKSGINRILVTELSRADFGRLLTAAQVKHVESPLYFYLDGGVAKYGDYLNREHRIQNRQPTTLADQGIMNRKHDFESSSKGRSCCGGSK